MSKTEETVEMAQEPEMKDKDFVAVLDALLNVYRPILEEELERARSSENLIKEADKNPPDCEEEIALADRLFDKFLTQDTAMLILGPQALKELGPISEWEWCWKHIICCLKFGWLLSRARTFSAAAYYLRRYWLCVRQVLGQKVGAELTPQDQTDLEFLIEALAKAYQPFLTEQLQATAAPRELAARVIAGDINCEEGLAQTEQIFDHFFTPEIGPALYGKEAFERIRQSRHFWFCRCWCLCTLRFGFCLGRARSVLDLLRCLLAYWRCVRECFRPLTCKINQPTGCVEEQINQTVGGMAVEVVGTATGAFFSHYTLQWRKVEGHACEDDSGWSSVGVVYPGGTATGAVPVVNGTLGWINTTALPAGSYEIRLCVHPTVGARLCCCIQFNLFKRLVWIERVAIAPGAPVQTPPGPLACNPPIVNTNPGGIVVPVGGCVTVKGSAWVGECNNRRIKCFDLKYAQGWQPCPTELGFAASLPLYAASMLVPTGPVCYTDPNPVEEMGKRAQWNWVIGRALTTRLVKTTIDLGGGITIDVWKLQDFCFNSASLLPLGVSAGGCPDPHHRCRSGKYTLLLQVEDTLGGLYYDTQQVWFDNKPIYVEFAGLEGLPGCTDLHLSAGTKFVPPGAPCNTAWPVNMMGIAYDEYIDETDPTYPSDNFDHYSLYITRQGGPTLVVPITPDLVTYGLDPLQGTSRVGEPGVRCEPVPAVGGCPPPPAIPPQANGLLTKLDLRVFDAVCAPSIPASEHYTVPAGFPLERGTCCGYTFQLYAQDKTWSDGYAGGLHNKWSLPWAVCICNDLPTEAKK